MIVVSDTTPIIALLKAERLDLLQKLYHTVVIPEAVYQELIVNSVYEKEKEIIQNCPFLRVEKVDNKESVSHLKQQEGLDAGESEALVLYEEKGADLILIDEHKGRSVAKAMAVEYIGTLGVLMIAYDKKVMMAREVEQCLDIFLDNEIRLSRNLCNRVLKYVGLRDRF